MNPDDVQGHQVSSFPVQHGMFPPAKQNWVEEAISGR